MIWYEYNTSDERLIRKLDKEFQIVTLINTQEHGYSKGYDVAIYSSMSKNSIRKKITELKSEKDMQDW